MNANSIEMSDLMNNFDTEVMTSSIERSLSFIEEEYKKENRQPLLKFFYHYVDWNKVFAGNVCALVAKISEDENGVLKSIEQSFQFAQDRSYDVASYIFEAAKDEYSSANRPAHRVLAQLFLKDLIKITGEKTKLSKNDEALLINSMLEPSWFSERTKLLVKNGYAGKFGSNLHDMFKGIGFHLGSELLADLEFSVLSSFLKKLFPDHHFVWLNAHAGTGDKLEDYHFNQALKGANLAIELASKISYSHIPHVPKEEVIFGFCHFVTSQASFFEDLYKGIK